MVMAWKMQKIILRWKADCSLTVMKPFPLQYENRWDRNGALKNPYLTNAALKRDRNKLVNHYAKLGFRKIPGSDLYGRLLEAPPRPRARVKMEKKLALGGFHVVK